MIKKHRDSQKRRYFEDAVYFVTTNTKNWYPHFREQIFCDLFVEELRLCKQMKEFKLFAWFLGYDHFHMQLQPGDEFNYSDVMQFLKRNFSRNANYVMGFNQYDELSIGNTGDNHHCRVREEGIAIFKCDNHPQPEGDNDIQSNGDSDSQSKCDNHPQPEGDNDIQSNGDSDSQSKCDNHPQPEGDNDNQSNGDSDSQSKCDNHPQPEGDNDIQSNGDSDSQSKCDNHPQPEGDNDNQSNGDSDSQSKCDNHPQPEGDNDNCRISGTDNQSFLRRFVYIKFIFRFRFKFKYLNQNPFPKFRWFKSFHDHFSRNDSDFDYHMEYIIWNPQKHNMPENWPYIFTNPKYANLVNGIY